MSATDAECDAMRTELQDTWGADIVDVTDAQGRNVTGAVVIRLADLRADYNADIAMAHDLDLFVRRADVTCPCGNFAGAVLITDEAVRAQDWEPLIGQIGAVTRALRGHREACSA